MTYDKNKFQKSRIQNVIIRMMKSEMWKVENRKREKRKALIEVQLERSRKEPQSPCSASFDGNEER